MVCLLKMVIFWWHASWVSGPCFPSEPPSANGWQYHPISSPIRGWWICHIGFASKLCHLCWRLFEYVVPELDFTRKIAWWLLSTEATVKFQSLGLCWTPKLEGNRTTWSLEPWNLLLDGTAGSSGLAGHFPSHSSMFPHGYHYIPWNPMKSPVFLVKSCYPLVI